MAEQVIIEFVGDTTKLEEAYDKLNEQVTTAGNRRCSKCSASDHLELNMNVLVSRLKQHAARAKLIYQCNTKLFHLQAHGLCI